MNDFTKEQLEKIIIWGELHNSGAGIAWPKMGSKKSNKELINKIRIMIDNYCEHEYSAIVFDGPPACNKCGRYL